jgi:ubiquitin-activating enzyme E1
LFELKSTKNSDTIKNILKELPRPKISIDKNIKISVNDEEEKMRLDNETKVLSISDLISSLPDPKNYQNIKINPQEFEKDDDNNYHIDFITASSNLRATNYDIKVEDRHSVKGIAGKIIPALSTTTSIVAGLVTLELYKLVQKFDEIGKYRNTFLNLALPYIDFSEPVPVPFTKLGDQNFSMWDTFIIKGDFTLQEFLDFFETNYKLNLETVTYGNFMLYSLIINPKKLLSRLNMKIKDILENELNSRISSTSVTLQIYASSDDMENDVELPEVLYIF